MVVLMSVVTMLRRMAETVVMVMLMHEHARTDSVLALAFSWKQLAVPVQGHRWL